MPVMFCILVKDDFQVSRCWSQVFQNDRQAENIDYAVGDIFELLVSPQFGDIAFTKIFLPGSRSLFVSQSNNRSELISVRIESRFCYYEGFLMNSRDTI